MWESIRDELQAPDSLNICMSMSFPAGAATPISWQPLERCASSPIRLSPVGRLFARPSATDRIQRSVLPTARANSRPRRSGAGPTHWPRTQLAGGFEVRRSRSSTRRHRRRLDLRRRSAIPWVRARFERMLNRPPSTGPIADGVNDSHLRTGARVGLKNQAGELGARNPAQRSLVSSYAWERERGRRVAFV